MLEKRKLVRKKAKQVIEIFEIFDRDTEKYVGRAVDLTIAGMMLLSSSPVPVNRIFQFRMLLPRSLLGVDAIDFGTESLWGSPASDNNQYWTGFQIIDISEQSIQVIEELTKDWSC